MAMILPILKMLPKLPEKNTNDNNFYKINRLKLIDNKWTPTFLYADRYNEIIRDFDTKALRDHLFTSTHAIIQILGNYGRDLDQKSEIMREQRACLEDRFQVDGALVPLDYGFEEDRYSPFLSEITSILENKFPLDFELAETEKSRFGREYEYLIDGECFFEQGEGYEDDLNVHYLLIIFFLFYYVAYLGTDLSFYFLVPLLITGSFIGFFWGFLEDLFLNQYQLIFGYSNAFHTPTDFDENEEEDLTSDDNDDEDQILNEYQSPIQEEDDEYDEFSNYDDIDEEDDLEDVNSDFFSYTPINTDLYEARQFTLEKEVKRRKLSKWNRLENVEQDDERFLVWQLGENYFENYGGFHIEEGDNIGYIEEMSDQGETDEGIGDDYIRDYFVENSKNFNTGPLVVPPFWEARWRGKPDYLGMYMWLNLSAPYLDIGDEDLADYNLQNWGDLDKDEEEDHEFDFEVKEEEDTDVPFDVEDLDVDDDLQGYDDDPDTQVEFLYSRDIYDEDFADSANIEFINDFLEDEFLLPVSSRFSEKFIYFLLNQIEKYLYR